MKFSELLNFIKSEMMMQENYQPVVLRKLLLSKNASREEIEEELRKYNPESESKSMTDTVLTVLGKRNNVIRKEGDRFVINTSHDLSREEIQELVNACTERIEEYESESEYDESDNYLTSDDFDKFLNAISKVTGDSSRKFDSYYWKVFFRLLYGCGLRIGEAQNLLVNDIDLDNRIITIRPSKKSRVQEIQQTTILPEDVLILKDYLSKYEFPDGRLFGDVTRQTVWSRAKEIGLAAKLKIFERSDIRLSNNLLRNSREVQMRNDQADPALIWLKLRKPLHELPMGRTKPNFDSLKLWEEKMYPVSTNNMRFFIALGPWSNWEHTINNPPFRWGVNPSSASNVGVFDALQSGDIVYFYANKDNPTPFSNRGLFGVGRVTRKYDEDSERYWPDEKLKDEVIYKHRFEIEPLKIVKSDSELLPWIEGLPFTKGLNRIANESTLKQLIDNTEKIWNIRVASENTSYWKISPGEAGEDWENQKSRGLIGIHFFDFDLTRLSEDDLREKIRREYGTEEVAKRANTFGQVRNFMNIKEGDIVVANSGKSKILGIGRVVGPYKYRQGEKFPHTFPVDWYDTTESTIPKQDGWMVTVIPLKKEEFEKITKDRTNYLLLRYNPNKDVKWKDIFGKEYIFGKKANYKKVTKGTKAIWFDRQDGEYYFWGYGEISDVKENGEAITATFNDFVQLGESETSPKKGTAEIEHKITKSPGFNIQNSILQINEDIYNKIVNGETELESSDEPLVFPHETLESARREIKEQLLIDDQTIDKIVASLYSGKNVLLTGPVGTGKTHLAQLLPKLVWDNIGGYYPETVTATSDWTTQDVIGGIFPKIVGTDIAYIVQKGCVADTVSRNWQKQTSDSQKRVPINVDGTAYKGVWLVIDEFNRANIDRAFGQLFTALEYNELKIPTTDPEKNFETLKIPQDYRIIGTLNTFDKHFLFRISDALKRRFSFIEILPPKYEDNKEEKKFVVEKAIKGYEDIQDKLNIHSFQDVINDKNLIQVLDNLYEIMAFIRLSKNLGTALLISIFRLTLINYLTTKDWDTSLDSALSTTLLPQMESLHYWQLDSIMNFVGGRIHDMFRRYDVNKKPDVDRYEEELKNLTKFLKMSNINKNAARWNSKFRSGQMTNQNLEELNPWKERIKPVLKEFRTGLEALKKEKGYFDDDEELIEQEK